MDKRKNNGGARPGAGRKPKAEEDKLKENLKPFEQGFFKAMEQGINKADFRWCKMFAEYMYGKPRESKDIDITTDGESVVINYVKPEDAGSQV